MFTLITNQHVRHSDGFEVKGAGRFALSYSDKAFQFEIPCEYSRSGELFVCCIRRSAFSRAARLMITSVLIERVRAALAFMGTTLEIEE